MSALVPYLTAHLAEAADQLLDERDMAKVAMMTDELRSIQADLVPVESAVGAHTLNELLGRAAVATKELESTRKRRVEPLNEEVKQINAIFKAITVHLDDITTKGKGYLVAWTQRERARVQREQEEAQRKQREAAAAEAVAMAKAEAAKTSKAREKALAEAEAASVAQVAAQIAEPMAAPKAYRGDFGTSSLRKVWRFEVVDQTQVPREFCIVDEKKIRAAVLGGSREIPGVSIYLDETVQVR